MRDTGGDEISAGYRYQVLGWYLDMLKEKNIKKINSDFSKFLSIYQQPENYINGSSKRLFGQGGSTPDGSVFFDKNFFSDDFKKKLKI